MSFAVHAFICMVASAVAEQMRLEYGVTMPGYVVAFIAAVIVAFTIPMNAENESCTPSS